MDLMRGLTQADGCAVDGTTSMNQNPITQMVNQMMNAAPGTTGMKGAQQQQGMGIMGNMMGHSVQGITGPSLPGQFVQHQQHLSVIDQGIANGMGLNGISALAPISSIQQQQQQHHHHHQQQQQMNGGDRFLQEFEAERQRQQFGIHGGASGLLGPRDISINNGNNNRLIGDEWINQFEKLKFGAGPYRPGHSMHDTFNQQFHQRAQGWRNEFNEAPSSRYGDMNELWKKQQNLENGEVWANEASYLKEQEEIALNESLKREGIEGTNETESSAVSGDVEATRQATSEMADILSRNPKFKNSQFLDFMKQVSSGDLIFQNNEVIANPNKPMEERTTLSNQEFERAWEASGEMGMNGNNSWVYAGQKMESLFQDAWKNAWNEVNEGEYDDEGNIIERNVDDKFNNALNRSEEEYAKWQKSINEYESLWNQQSMGDINDINNNNYDNIINHNIESGIMMSQKSLQEIDYEFMKEKEENKYINNESAFEEGMRLFNDGRLIESIIAFEAVIINDETNSEAWRMLGIAHQERDEDIPAIACFQKAIEQDAFNLDAMIGLSVSLVNEGYGTEALNMLKLWIKSNPNYHGIEFEPDEFSDGSLLDEVMQLMLKASKYSPNDANIQEVLGVLYNVSEDYESAVIAFKKAIDAKPNDYSLWNKLGATLANGKKSEEAIPAYHRAIELKPRYARAWQNLGIAHNILLNYYESARCFLKALDLNPNSDHIWNQLRWCFVHMKRYDLVALVDSKDLELFRKEFGF